MRVKGGYLGCVEAVYALFNTGFTLGLFLLSYKYLTAGYIFDVMNTIQMPDGTIAWELPDNSHNAEFLIAWAVIALALWVIFFMLRRRINRSADNATPDEHAK